MSCLSHNEFWEVSFACCSNHSLQFTSLLGRESNQHVEHQLLCHPWANDTFDLRLEFARRSVRTTNQGVAAVRSRSGSRVGNGRRNGGKPGRIGYSTSYLSRSAFCTEHGPRCQRCQNLAGQVANRSIDTELGPSPRHATAFLTIVMNGTINRQGLLGLPSFCRAFHRSVMIRSRAAQGTATRWPSVLPSPATTIARFGSATASFCF